MISVLPISMKTVQSIPANTLCFPFPTVTRASTSSFTGKTWNASWNRWMPFFLAHRWSTTRNLVRQYLYHCHGDHQRRRAGTDRTVPRFLALTDYNANALKAGDSDGDREHYRHDDTIQELFREDLRSLLALPSVAFELSGMKTITTNGWGKFTLYKGKHEYSVSPRHTHAVVTLKLTSAAITVQDENLHEIITHKRLYGDKKQESMKWLPYLNYISRHPCLIEGSTSKMHDEGQEILLL